MAKCICELDVGEEYNLDYTASWSYLALKRKEDGFYLIGHGDDLLMLYSRISRVTTFYPISHYCSTDAVALFNLRGHAVQLQRSRCSIWCGILRSVQ